MKPSERHSVLRIGACFYFEDEIGRDNFLVTCNSIICKVNFTLSKTYFTY